MRDHGGTLSFKPRLPAALSRLAFSIMWRGSRLHLDITAEAATYSSRGEHPVALTHHGHEVVVSDGETHRLPIPAVTTGEAPKQVPGRGPVRRSSTA
jgi:alpha,alpha-trehalose phosphorylase